MVSNPQKIVFTQRLLPARRTTTSQTVIVQKNFGNSFFLCALKKIPMRRDKFKNK